MMNIWRINPKPATDVHPKWPVIYIAIALKLPKLAELTNMVISIPEMPDTGNWFTMTVTIKNLKLSSAWKQNIIIATGIFPVGNII